jgi:hypothetical protein
MILKTANPAMAEDVVKRAMFIGYNACGGTSGMGIFQALNNATEDQVWNNIITKGDYPGGNSIPGAEGKKRRGDKIEVYGDYVFGRMMKTSFAFNTQTGEIEISDSVPRRDYQGWSSNKNYKTYESLIREAAKQLSVELS